MKKPTLKYAYVIASSKEAKYRIQNVRVLKSIIPNLIEQPAIYPNETRVPFINKLKEKSKKRTGKSLNEGEIGILLANRAIWKKIVALHPQEDEYFLIMESDSLVNDHNLLLNQFFKFVNGYDLFFFGGWYGNIRLKRSTRKNFNETYSIGVPVYKTMCCCYGYAVNIKAVKELLHHTKQIGHPVDEFKKYLPEGLIKIGAIEPELISEKPGFTTIGHPTYDYFPMNLKMFLVHIRNKIWAYLS